MDIVHSRGIVVIDEMKQVAVPLLVNPFTKQHCVVPFSQEIVGIIETTTTSNLVLDGEVINEGSTYTDYYGFLTSTQDMWNAKKPSSPVIRETTIEVTLRYFVREVINKSNTYRNPGYHPIPNDWYDVGVGAPEANTVDNLNAWFNTRIMHRYVKGEDEEYHPIMPEPEELRPHVVGTTKFDSDMPRDDQVKEVCALVERLKWVFPNKEMLFDSALTGMIDYLDAAKAA